MSTAPPTVPDRSALDRPRLLGIVCGLSVLATACSLSTIIEGGWWLITSAVLITMISANGCLMRRINAPAVLISCGQFAVLALSMTLMFGSGWGRLPGPTGIRGLVDLLAEAIGEVRTAVPPVPATTAVACLVTLGVGLIAVLADTVAVTGRAPAAAGLVLLTMFAVPTQLDARLLPWWSFVLAGSGFAALLAVDGKRRAGWHRARALTRASTGPTAGLIAVSLLIALVSGGVFTMIGTEGRLPDPGDPGFDIDPFTSLSGQLDRPEPVDLFRVKGDIGRNYLRALTLRRYDASRGVWQPDGIEDGVKVTDQPLPMPPGVGEDTPGPRPWIEVERLNYSGPWLPTIGIPLRMDHTPTDLRYDSLAGTAFIQSGARGQPDRYAQQSLLPDPSDESLRRAVGPLGVDRRYLDIDGVSDRVEELARRITERADNDFDRARALSDYFRDPANGFRYDLKTKPGGIDPLDRFLFEGRTGYCQQFAGSMAVLARAARIPARVAVGYTGGASTDRNTRVISTNDAHAWVEVWLAGHGWVTFDPTPGLDGRAVPPPYQRPGQTPTATSGPDQAGGTQPSPARPETSDPDGDRPPDPAADRGGEAADQPVIARSPVLAVLAWPFAIIALFALALSGILRVHRRAGPGAVEEVLTDLGVHGEPSHRVRTALRRYPLEISALVGLGSAGVAVLLLSGAAASTLWWLITIVLAAGAATLTPWAIRRGQSRGRLRLTAVGGVEGAQAAWRELIATALDRDVRLASSVTVRASARLLERELTLDAQARTALGSFIELVERAWYSGHPESDQRLSGAAERATAAIRRARQPHGSRRLFPRSVTHPMPGARSAASLENEPTPIG